MYFMKLAGVTQAGQIAVVTESNWSSGLLMCGFTPHAYVDDWRIKFLDLLDPYRFFAAYGNNRYRLAAACLLADISTNLLSLHIQSKYEIT
jgi:hypothetical protein